MLGHLSWVFVSRFSKKTKNTIKKWRQKYKICFRKFTPVVPFLDYPLAHPVTRLTIFLDSFRRVSGAFESNWEFAESQKHQMKYYNRTFLWTKKDAARRLFVTWSKDARGLHLGNQANAVLYMVLAIEKRSRGLPVKTCDWVWNTKKGEVCEGST